MSLRSALLGLGLVLMATALFSSALISSQQPLPHSSAPASAPAESQRSSTPPPRHSMVTITASLVAREDRLPPLGLPPNPNREIGFATVVVHLDNPQDARQVVTLEAIDILSEPEQQPQPFVFKPRTLELKPMERSVVDIHLSNRTGFPAKGRVKAFVRYHLGSGPVATVASEAVAIERR